MQGDQICLDRSGCMQLRGIAVGGKTILFDQMQVVVQPVHEGTTDDDQ